MHILLVDDKEIFIRSIARLLRNLDHTVQCARNGEDALQRIGRHPVDLVISDIQMSPIDGFQLFHAIQKKKPDLPVILMSGYIEEGIIRRVAREGVHKVLPKTVDTEELLEAIEALTPPQRGECLERPM